MKYLQKIVLLLIFLNTVATAQMSSVPVQPRAAQTPARVVAQTANPAAQPPPRPFVVQEDNTMWYVSIAALIAVLAGAIFYWRKEKTSAKEVEHEIRQAEIKAKQDDSSVDGDRELEWLRKNQELIDKRKQRSSLNRKNRHRLPDSTILSKKKAEGSEIVIDDLEKGVQLANKKDLPVFSISGVEIPEAFEALSTSRDESLLGAIDQINDEFEEDEKVRELAVRILAKFQNRNSVEALSEVALYDLSSTLRVKALIVLSEFDHESVFETILLACADPTREVRAAAARALTRLTFNRADAWTRIASLDDKWHLKQAADATIESGFVERSFERLVHNDYKQVYEAFALLNLLIKADKIDLILDRLENAKSMDVKIAILHVLKVTEASNSLPYLYSVFSRKGLPEDFGDALDAVIHRLGGVELAQA